MWLEVLKAVAPLIAALLAAGVGAWVAHKFGTIQAGIARQQAETAKAAAATAKSKLKFDLFSSRMTIYNASQDALTSLSYRGEKAEDADWKFRGVVQQSVWLFGEEVSDYLHNELWALIVRIREAQNLRDQADSQEKKAWAIEQVRLAREESFKQQLRINEVFAPYLRLES
jgi:hypothetical protein